MSRWAYSSLIPPPRLRLDAEALPLAPLVFFGVAFLVPPFVAFLRGVLVLDLALEMVKWRVEPEALAAARILTMRSEIARGVGRSRLVAEARLLASRCGTAMQEGLAPLFGDLGAFWRDIRGLEDFE